MQTLEDLYQFFARTSKRIEFKLTDTFSQYQYNIESILHMLSDADSRDAYLREIAVITLHTLFTTDYSASLAGVITAKDFSAGMAAIRATNPVPFLEYPEGGWEGLCYCLAPTFIFKQYQYKNLVKPEIGDICIDCGACLGDTTTWMHMQGAAAIHSFEIDQVNLECMERSFAKNKAYSNIHLVNKALSSKLEQLFYTPNPHSCGAGKVTDSPISPASYQVEAITLDDYCAITSLFPDFIKMDIEGAEPLALAGARQVFMKYRPKFAICIYHQYSHRFDIPMMLQEVCIDYDFYLKKSHPTTETVLFGIPREKNRKK